MADVLIGEEAEAEYIDALTWYAARSARAADGFEAAFAKAVAAVGEDPERFAECDEDAAFRYAPLFGYPYSLIFRVAGSRAHVVAVAHARRRPGYWHKHPG